MTVRRKHIREMVETLLKKYGVRSAPVPVEKIAQSSGIQIKLDEVDDDLSGFLFRDARSKTVLIGANKSHHPNRRRFTIAHELGHFMLHKGEVVHLDKGRGAFMLNKRDAKSATGEDDNEREANLFAAELLMPAKFLERDLRGQSFDILEEDVFFLSKLAGQYEVSVQALTIRLSYLGYIKT